MMNREKVREKVFVALHLMTVFFPPFANANLGKTSAQIISLPPDIREILLMLASGNL